MEDANDFKVKSLAKAMRVLESFSEKEPELGVSEIAQRLDLQKSTVFNILSTFQALGYVAQNPATGKYSLALKILHFSYIVNSHLDYQQIFLEPMNCISRETGEVCYLGIPYGNKVLYLASTVPQSGSHRSICGETAPMYCTGLGKSMLAFFPEEKRDEVLAEPKVKFTDSTITDIPTLIENLTEVRRNGFAVDNMEHEFGIRCVAVPIFDAAKNVVAAISVSGPSLRFDPVSVLRNYEIILKHIQPLQNRL